MHGLGEPEVGQETGNETHLKGPNPELAIRLDSPLRKEKTRDKTHLPNTQLINLIRIQEGTPRRASPAPQRGLYSGKSSCVGKWRGLDAKIFRKVLVPFEEPCFLKYVASKEDPLPQQLSWVGGKRKEESHLAPDNAISIQGRFLPTDVNPQLQSQLLAMTAAGLQTGGEISPYSEQENGVAHDYKNGTRTCMKQTAPYSVGANGVSALELLGLSQQEQTEPCNTNHTTLSPVGHEANEAYRRVAAKTTTSRPVGHDACIEPTEANAGHKDQPSGSSEDTDGVLAIAVLTAPYSFGANGVAALELLGRPMSQLEQTEPCNTNLTTLSPVGHEANEAHRRVAALALPGLFQQEQVKPGNANLTALYSLWCTLGANGAAYLDLARVRVFASFYDYKEDRAVSLYGPSRLLSSAPATSQMLSLAPTTSQMLSSAPATTGITTPLFGDTGIRLLQFLVEFHPGGVPSHGLASRDEGHSAAAI